MSANSQTTRSIFTAGSLFAAMLAGLLIASCGGGGNSSSGSANGTGGTPPVVPPLVMLPPVVTTAISQFVDDPANIGVRVIATSPNTLTAGAFIVISGSTIPAYNGTFAVVSATATTFTITAVFAGTTASAAWQAGGGAIAGCVTTGATSAITLSTVPSRFTGVGPLAVFFDATATTATATARPFHDLEYQWSFGDPGSGTWSTGSRAGTSSRNSATGAVAAHVFETPGTYIVSLTITDGTNTVSNACVQIAVLDPAIVFGGLNTICIANSTPAQGLLGCPSGAATPAGTNNFNTALAACTTGKRCLFKGGDVFAASAFGQINNAGPITIGSYGSGAAAITSTNLGGVLALFNSAVNDLRIMDLDIAGSGVSDTGNCVVVGASPTNITVLRLGCHDIGGGVIMTSGANITASVIQDSHIFNMTKGVGIFGWAIDSAYLGNFIGPFGIAEHNIRLQPGQRVAISNNTLTTPGEDGSHGKQVLTIRALEHVPSAIDPIVYSAPDTQFIYISDNKLSSGGSSAQMFQVAPAGATQNNHISDVIAERNWLIFGSVGSQGIYSEAVRLTVRNNICDTTGGVFRICYSVAPGDTTGNVPAPDDNRFYNNTCYAGDTSTQFFCIALASGPATNNAVTNSVVANNLSFGPLTTSPKLLSVSGAAVTGTIGASGTLGNSSDAQVNSSPNFLNASGLFNTPSDFKLPPAGSYATGLGTGVPVWSDFFRVTEPSPRDSGAVNH